MKLLRRSGLQTKNRIKSYEKVYRLTMRNLRKRRHRRQVKMAETPGPKWESGGQAGSPLPPGLSLIRSA